MYARIKQSGSRRYLQIVRSVRIDGQPRQQVLLTLGRVETLLQDGTLDQLLQSLSRFSPRALTLIADASQPQTQCWKLGPALIFERLWQRCGFPRLIQELLQGRHYEFNLERALFVSVLHRLLCSGSDRHASTWLAGHWIAGARSLQLHHFYRAMAWLGEPLDQAADQQAKEAGQAPVYPLVIPQAVDPKAAVATPPESVATSKKKPKPKLLAQIGLRTLKDRFEEHWFLDRQDLFSELTLAFFDTTSLYFVGAGGQTLGQLGKSKDHCPECHQLVVGLVLDGEGTPLCCEIWPGNTADVTTLIPVAERLQQRFHIKRICLVSDRGMISQATMAELERRQWQYILGVRMRAVKTVKHVVLGALGKPNNPQWREGFEVVHAARQHSKDPSPLEIKEVKASGQRYIVCYSPEQARKDEHDRQAILANLAQALKAGDKSLVGNRGYRRYLQVPGKKAAAQGAHFQIDQAKVQAEARYDGLWVLQTNTALPGSAVALSYKQLWRVEALFRQCKAVLRTRPIYHKVDETIRGHVFCTFLALVLMRELERALEQAGVEWEWKQGLQDLEALQRMQVQEGDKTFWIRSQLQGCTSRVFAAVGVAIPKLIERGTPQAMKTPDETNTG